MNNLKRRLLAAVLTGVILLCNVPMAGAETITQGVNGWKIGEYGAYEFDVTNENIDGIILTRSDNRNQIPLVMFHNSSVYDALDFIYEQESYAGFPIIYNIGLYSLTDSENVDLGTSDFLKSENCIQYETPYQLIVLEQADAIDTPDYTYSWEIISSNPSAKRLQMAFEDSLTSGYYEYTLTFPEDTGSFSNWRWMGAFTVDENSEVNLIDVSYNFSEEETPTGEPMITLRKAIASISGDGFIQTIALTIDPENDSAIDSNSEPQENTPIYLYDAPDPGESIDFSGMLDNVDDEASAVDAVEQAAAGLTDEQKQSETGIDKLTLLAEEAAAKATTVSASGGEVNVTAADVSSDVGSALSATTGALSDAGITTQRNARTILNYDAGSSETVSVTTEALPKTVDRVRVTTEYAAATVDAQQASSFTMTDRGSRTVEVNFDTDSETMVTVSFPGMSMDETYVAVMDEEGNPVGGKYNPATGTLEAKLTESGVYQVVNNEKDFADIKAKSQEMQEAIKLLASKGIINGTNETMFEPDSTISRAEVTALLMRTLSLLDPNADGGFTDVTPQNWYYGAAGSAKEHNIINGFEDNTFRGDAVIAKDQIVSVSARTLREQMDYKTPSDVTGELSIYTDAGNIANWAREDVALATMTNLVLKRTDGKFDGSAGMTRGDAAIIVKRLFDKLW